MLKYGTDKPDLRNPLIISDVTSPLRKVGFRPVREDRRHRWQGPFVVIPAPNTHEKSRKFFDEMNDWARKEGFAGLGYVTRKGGEFGGPIAKNHGHRSAWKSSMPSWASVKTTACSFAAGKEKPTLPSWQVPQRVPALPSSSRTDRGRTASSSAWIVDFPMSTNTMKSEKKVDFSHNPFSMPQGEMEALENQGPARPSSRGSTISSATATNSSSGSPSVTTSPDIMVQGVRNRRPTPRPTWSENFGWHVSRLSSYGAPPHGGFGTRVSTAS